MLILHAAQVEGNLVLWSEDSEPRMAQSDRQADGKHPYCAQAQRIAEAVGLETGDDSYASAIGWLPSRGEAPVPSSPMAGPMPKSRAKPRIRPWTVTTLRLGPEQAAPVAADVPPAAGPETRRRHRNRPGLLDPRPGAGSLPDGPATIPARPVRTWRPERGGMDSGVHRRRRPPAGRAGRIDAGISKGAHRHRGHRTAIHPGPSRPPGVHNSPGRPSGTRRHGYRKPGATRVRLRPRRLAVRLEPSQPGGPEQPGAAPATPPPGRRMAKAPGHRRQLSIPALPQAGGAARTRPRGRDTDHPAG